MLKKLFKIDKPTQMLNKYFNKNIYIIQYYDYTELVDKERFEREVRRCYKYGINYVVNTRYLSKELVLCN